MDSYKLVRSIAIDLGPDTKQFFLQYTEDGSDHCLLVTALGIDHCEMRHGQEQE